jgi:hypothetical protein
LINFGVMANAIGTMTTKAAARVPLTIILEVFIFFSPFVLFF